MRISHRGLDFEVKIDTILPCINKDMTEFNRKNPERQITAYHFVRNDKEAGVVALEVEKLPRIIWVHDFTVEEDQVNLRQGYGTAFMYHALIKTKPQLQNPSNYKVRPSGTTQPGRDFFAHYEALSGINYLEFIKKLGKKINV